MQKIIRPMFEAENNYKGDIRYLLLDQIKIAGIKGAIVSFVKSAAGFRERLKRILRRFQR